MTELILYTCPTGDLAAQLDRYFALSRSACGENAAHRYMPHITLTGFFHAETAAIDLYLQQLDRVAAAALDAGPAPVITLTQIAFQENFHGILVESPWLKRLTVDFIESANTDRWNEAIEEIEISPAGRRREAIRKKDRLHLSLAYDFSAEQDTTLKRLAKETLHLDAQVSWELRFYERHPDNSWTCHRAWPLER